MGFNESDTRSKLINPALYGRGWTEEHIRREENAGQIIIVNGKARRRTGRIDFTLRIKISESSQPVAIALIEAKAEDLPPTHGIEQVKVYNECERFNVPFLYSTNGHLFVEFDCTTGITSASCPISQFPTPDELRVRYELFKGFKLNSEAAKPLVTPYSAGAEGNRRYYQDAAIRAALEKIAAGGNRVLLTLATGAGKTFLAVQLLKRISDAGQMRRALFLCDRDELRTQATAAFQNAFGNDAAVVDSKHPQTNARVLIATYQTLDVDTDDAEGSFLRDNYPENYFSHIVIDECHRSAWGKWSEVLKRNPKAIQIGLTATPRQLTEGSEDNKEARADQKISVDNLKHFGEPVYEYDIGQGIEDGYLAACEIHKGRVNIDDTGVTIEDILALDPKDAITGQPISEDELKAYYEAHQFEDSILLPDRVWAMANDLFLQILERNNGDPHQKTIIFCVRDTHCDAVTTALNNLYAQWCRENGQAPKRYYAFKATAASGGAQYLADLRGSSQSHFIATTVELLSTGVDVPRLENIVFFRYMNSPISFYQMIGRGTRIFAPNNKLMFRVYDYTNATRLFGEAFITKLQGERTSNPDGLETVRDRVPLISVEGLDVVVNDAGDYILTTIDGRETALTLEEYRERLARQLQREAATLAEFRAKWIDPTNRHALLDSLPDGERSVLLLQRLQDMDAYDLFDVLAELGYGLDAKTRLERAEAFSYKQTDWLKSFPPAAAATIQAIAAQFSNNGIDSLENPQLWNIPAVRNAGGLQALKALNAAKMLTETKERIYAA
jgi:type I restriction enzyme, R subunit